MTTQPSLAERNRKTVEAFLAGTHSPDIEDVAVIDRTVAPGIVCHGFPGGNPRDHESYKDFFRVFRQAFADMHFHLHSLVADERFVAARWQIQATHNGAFAGVAADGRRIVFDGMVLYRMQDGLIAETWLHVNEIALLSQIGALQAQAS